MVDEAVRMRFSIFPSVPVGIGASWERTILLTEPSNPKVRSLLDEKFKLVQTSSLKHALRGIGKEGWNIFFVAVRRGE